jgi:hypothetical protein
MRNMDRLVLSMRKKLRKMLKMLLRECWKREMGMKKNNKRGMTLEMMMMKMRMMMKVK